ncbi:hypothetical protein BBP40_011929 [Aspergillus hancockii]|nr:hypothetical protein BBP40_011929 [Aspergillus hancockii]
MASLQYTRHAKGKVRDQPHKQVAVFVGGTSGIGEATAKQFAKTIESPTIYIIGRNRSAAARILQRLQSLNPRGTFEFIQSDVSLLREVDAAYTVEGLDNNHVLRYYARMRFIHNLLPQLKSAESSARVVTVLAAGKEGDIDESNFDLQASFSFGTAATYGATMNSLAVEYLASKHTSISFIHVFPGTVQTPLMRASFGTILGLVIGLLTRMTSISAQESGERSISIITSSSYPPFAHAGTNSSDDVRLAMASTGKVGGGSYLLNYDGMDVTNQGLMENFRKKGYPTKLWDHTLDIFQRVLGPDA